MQLKTLLEKWDLTSLKVKAAHWERRGWRTGPACELYVEPTGRAPLS